jgi:ubiquinone/menaquinone biosynthesis C-methylase UbiE
MKLKQKCFLKEQINMTTVDLKKMEWESSYTRGENHVFLPSDEVVRFVSRYLRRRVDLDKVIDISPAALGSMVLDLGSGLGRNLLFGESMGLRMHGLELSSLAVTKSHQLLQKNGVVEPEIRVKQGDARNLPWPDAYFDHALSDSVLDSMPLEIAQDAVKEVARVVKSGGLFYLNLVAKINLVGGGTSPDFEIVSTTHEKDTYQTYFDSEKWQNLLADKFEIVFGELHNVQNISGQTIRGRWHIVCRRK